MNDETPANFLESQIYDLRKKDLRDVEASEIAEPISALCRGLRAWNAPMPIIAVCRGREIRVDNVSDISYRPISTDGHFGRLNSPDESLFYCCEDHCTVLTEIRDRAERVLCIMDWEPQTPGSKARFAHLGFNTQALNRVRNPGIKEFMQKHNAAMVKDLTDEEISTQNTITSFLNEEFNTRVCESENFRYKITASIAQMFFKQKNVQSKDYPFAGILYPSVERGAVINMALLPGFVDKYLKPTRAILYKLTRQEKHIHAHEIETGVVGEGGEITWTRSPSDKEMVTKVAKISPVE